MKVFQANALQAGKYYNQISFFSRWILLLKKLRVLSSNDFVKSET